MKNLSGFITVFFVCALCAGFARASNVDFYNFDKNSSKDSKFNHDGKNNSDWNDDSGKGNKHNSDWNDDSDKGGDKDFKDFKDGGYSSRSDFSDWGKKNYSNDRDDKDKQNGDRDWGKYKDEKGDGVPPPICSAADPGHDGKWGGDSDWDKDKDKGKYHSGWGDDDGGKDKDWWGHKYYRKICDGDKDPHHPRGHKHGCDPGDPGSPTPIPGTLPLFTLALGLIVIRNRTQRLS